MTALEISIQIRILRICTQCKWTSTIKIICNSSKKIKKNLILMACMRFLFDFSLMTCYLQIICKRPTYSVGRVVFNISSEFKIGWRDNRICYVGNWRYEEFSFSHVIFHLRFSAIFWFFAFTWTHWWRPLDWKKYSKYDFRSKKKKHDTKKKIESKTYIR